MMHALHPYSNPDVAQEDLHEICGNCGMYWYMDDDGYESEMIFLRTMKYRNPFSDGVCAACAVNAATMTQLEGFVMGDRETMAKFFCWMIDASRCDLNSTEAVELLMDILIDDEPDVFQEYTKDFIRSVDGMEEEFLDYIQIY